MDSVFGLQGKDFVLVACDGSVGHSIIRITDSEDKITKLDSHKLLALSGQGADRNSFSDVVEKNLNLIRYRTGSALSMKKTAHFIRSQYARALREGPYQCNAMLAGFDAQGPSLYWLDYLGSLQQITRGAHGYAAHFLLGLLDNQYRADLTIQQGLDIVKKCVHELQTRFLMAQSKFIVKVVTAKGIEVLTL